MIMQKVANLLFEAKMLKEIPRSGYPFLGFGRESVAEHTYLTTFIAYVLGQLAPHVDAHKLICMCLIHDLPEARTGDLNTVHKNYVRADEDRALSDATRDLPFAAQLTALAAEFNAAETPEARLARDADQIALIVELKDLADLGHPGPEQWIPNVMMRLQTKAGMRLAQAVLNTERDAWWRDASVPP